MSRLIPLWIAASLCLSLIGCSTSSDHGASIGIGDAGTVMPPPTGGACDTPNQGCECQDEGQIVECGQVERVSGDYVSCSTGHRTCADGKWGACIGDSVTTQQLARGKQRIQGLGSGMDCAAANPCDPFCRFQVDDGTNLPLPDGGALAADGNGIRLVPHDLGGGAGSCTSMIVKPTPQSTTITSLAPATAGTNGLLGEYFNQIDPNAGQIPTSWVPTGTRLDPSVVLDWGNGSPNIPGVGADGFSVRWTGSVVAPATNPYTICANTDDGVRLWIDGVLRIDDWVTKQASDDCTAPMNWTANSVHSLRFEYFEVAGLASATLAWSSPSIPLGWMPSSAFTPPGTGFVPVLSSTPQFQIELSPPGCFPGTPQPAWTLDRLDLGTIDNTGKVSLISAVAGPITATAYLGQLSASGVLNVKVDLTKNDLAPTGSVTQFQGTAAGADTAAILYPYDQTVMPLGLQPPQVQWDNKGSAASAVKLSLIYPSTGAPSFRWSQIIPESSPPRATIPADVWAYFSQTAKANSAGVVLQRIVGGQLKTPLATRVVNFSSAPVRGKIYYTQYHRGGDANEMVVDPGSAQPAQTAFSTTDGCPVCHTVSANGNVFATSSRYGLENNNYGSPITFSSTLGGVSSVNASGGLTPIADFVANPPRPNYTVGSVDWRGFAWAPLTPDGKYALVATNVWGNTKENLVGINGGNRQVNTGNTMLSGGSGTGLLAEYFATTDATFATLVWKRIDPQVNFDFGAGSPGGLVPVDFSVRRSGRIQAFFSETYHFEVVTTGSDVFNLTVGATSVGPFTGPGTLTADVPMTAGAFANFQLKQQNTTGNSNVQLFWSSPSTPRALVPQTQLYPPAAEPAHGANVTYNDGVSPPVTLIEPDIASNWQAHGPGVGLALGADNWTSTWDAQVESPFTGAMQLCIDSDDGVKLYLDGSGTALIDSAASYNNCVSTPSSWVFGAKHTVHIVHSESTGNARLIFKYKYGTLATSEVVPTVNLYPVTPPTGTNGLTATYYDIEGFNAALPATQTNPRAFQRVDPNIDFDWDLGRPNYSIISDDDHFSVRWTGKITMACDGVYSFRSNGNIDDGGRLWIDDSRVMARWGYGALQGAGYFSAGNHDFKFDYYDDGSNAVARLQWKTPCAGSPGWVTIPSSVFTPNATYNRTTGYVVDGGDNGDNSSYWVWQLPTSASPTPVDVTASSAGRWGLSGTAMMVPSFSPNGSKLVFIDGDSAGNAGWRKGLSTFDFDQTGKSFKNRRLITSTWPAGDAMKWPTFESDSRSVIYQTTVPGDSCCRTSSWKKYGYMGPTNYYEDPGRLWSIDTQAAAPTPVALTKLNSGEQAKDANKSYQPTMLPVASGGYRWVVFTSTRPYGNTLNLPNVQQDFSNTASYATSAYTGMTNTSDIQSQLWVGAIDDATSGTVDRSHPGFWLPSQNFSTTASSGYINERGYWVLDACHPAGTSPTSTCEVDEDCCGGSDTPKTGACRLDTPLMNPPTRHCRALPPAGQCVATGGQCGTPTDCCSGLACIGAVCSTPPSVLVFGPSNYERIYKADCADGTKPVWRFFDWKAITPDTHSKLEFYAETQADPTLFATLPSYPLAVTASDVVLLGTATGPTVADWVGASVSERLDVDKMLKSQLYVKITIRFVPNDELTKSPVLQNWRQSYSCEPAE
ncbi:MAG: PA14 domain-containing protein [Myxococcales bacterium]